MLYKTTEEYDTAIEQTQDAIVRILAAGQERNIEAAGNKRDVREARLEDLRKHLSILQSERVVIGKGSRGSACYIGAGW